MGNTVKKIIEARQKSDEKLNEIRLYIERQIPTLNELIEKHKGEHEESRMYYEGCKFELERILNKFYK